MERWRDGGEVVIKQDLGSWDGLVGLGAEVDLFEGVAVMELRLFFV